MVEVQVTKAKNTDEHARSREAARKAAADGSPAAVALKKAILAKDAAAHRESRKAGGPQPLKTVDDILAKIYARADTWTKGK